MIDYVYTAKDLTSNETVSSTVKAESPEAAAKLLTSQKLFPIEIKPKTDQSFVDRFHLSRGISAKDKVLFTRQLSTLINAGLPLARALHNVQEQVGNPKLKIVISEVVAAVEGGSALSQAFGQHPNVFNEIYVALVAAGETSGTLDKTLLRLADQQEKDAAIASQIRSALIYPLIVLVLIVGVLVLMLTTVVPQVSQLYKDLHKDLPLITQLLVGLSTYMKNFWWLNIILLVGAVYGARKALKNDKVEIWLDRLKLEVPLFGKLFQKVYMARFARTMSALLSSGIPMLQALDTTRRAVGNSLVQDDLLKATEKVRGGKALSTALEDGAHFIPLVPQMIKIGEESGSIDEMMERVAGYYEAEVDEAVKNLSTTLEPVMMVILGAIVAVIIAAVLGPVYSLVGAGDIGSSSVK